MRQQDASVQARVRSTTLATLVQYYWKEENVRALRSTSALVRQALEDFVRMHIVHEGHEVVQSTIQANAILESIGLRSAVDDRAQMHNVQEEVMESEPHAARTRKRDAHKVPEEHRRVIEAYRARSAIATDAIDAIDSELDGGEFDAQILRRGVSNDT